MRQSAPWMVGVDDRILELCREHGHLTPKTADEYGATSANYASTRMSKLTQAGLLERVAHGVYRLTDDGAAYLDESLDASELPTPD